jgi:hypothetical protein
VVVPMALGVSFMKWLRKNWAFLILGLVVAAAVALFGLYWRDSNRLAALASLFGFIVTALLVGITIQYARTNQSSLKLLKEQWKAQNEVEVKFGLRERNETAQVWVLNYGLANIVVSKLVVEIQSRKPTTIYKNMVLRSGEKKRFHLPLTDWKRLQLQQNVQLTLFCESRTQQFEQTKVYTLFLTEGSKVYKVRKGLRGLWPVGCPKCEKFMGICMVTDGLESFADARDRQDEMNAELSASCPQHASRCLLTMEHVTAPDAQEIDV